MAVAVNTAAEEDGLSLSRLLFASCTTKSCLTLVVPDLII